MFDTVIEGRLVTRDGLQDARICISDGVIRKVSRTSPGSVDYGDLHRFPKCIIMAGAVDAHVHMRDPGMTWKEDLGTGTASAAFGGVTSIIDMPNTNPPTVDLASFMAKEGEARKKCHIDFGINLAMLNVGDPLQVFTELQDMGTTFRPVGLKVFLGETTASIVFDPVDGLRSHSRRIFELGIPLSVHAEDGGHFVRSVSSEKDGPELLMDHHRSRPPIAERSAIRKVCSAMGEASPSVHILHVSSREGMAQARKTDATVEVTPHHLLLDIKWCEKNLKPQSLAKVNPPVRTTDDRAALWDAVRDGRANTLGSDHAPHTLDEKERGSGSPSGMPGVETMVPLLLDKFMEQGIGLDVLQRLTAEGPARIFKLRAKGAIREGAHADIAIYDLGSARKVRPEGLHSKCGWTTYEGMKGIFPVCVFSRGEMIVDGENLCSRPGRGKDLSED